MISRYRNALMGLSILWIMFYHSGMQLVSVSMALFTIKRDGYGGVDLFLLISGFGLYYSLSKNQSSLSFYKRRLLRLLPAYLLFLAIFLFLRLPSAPRSTWLTAILGNLTGMSLLAGAKIQFNWYMLAIFFYYLLAPLFASILKQYGKKGGLLLLLSTLLLDICFLGNHIMIAISRFTVFVLGMILGYYFVEKGPLHKYTEAAVYISSFFSFIMLRLFREHLDNNILWNYDCYWYPFIAIAPALIFIFCRLFSLLESKTIGRTAIRIVSVIGECSLEIYLLHVTVFEYFHIGDHITHNLMWFPVYLVMVAGGYLLHQGFEWVQTRLSAAKSV